MYREDQSNTLQKFFGFIGLRGFVGHEDLEASHTEPNLSAIDGDDVVPQQLTVMPADVPPVMRVTEALTAATTQFVKSHVAPVIAADRSGLAYSLQTVTIRSTPQTAGVLAEFRRLPTSVKSRLTMNAFEKAAGSGVLTYEQFFGLDIDEGTGDLAGTVIEVLASGGRAKPFSFVFSGEFITRNDAAFKPLGPTGDAGSRVGGATPLRFQSGPTLKLVVYDHKAARGRVIEVSRFPARIGKGKDAEIRVDGKYVSELHARIDYDEKGFTLTDMSTNGTWLGRSDHLQRGQSRTLLRSGYFFLSAPPNAGDADSAPRIVFAASGSATEPAISTPIVSKPQPGGDTPIKAQSQLAGDTPIMSGHSDAGAGTADSAIAVSATPVAHAAGANSLVLERATATPIVLPKPRPLARIRLIETGKDDVVVDVREIPFCIGREPEGDGAPVPLSAQNVSRKHLRLIQPYGGNAMLVENLGTQRNGTFLGRDEQPARFRWKSGETLTLGGRPGEPKTIQILLEAV